MNKASTKTVRKSAPSVGKSTARELNRLAALPPGRPDEESPQWTAKQVAAASAARRGRVLDRAGRVRKQRITINVDEDLLVYFKSLGGPGYQTRINNALRIYVARQATAGRPEDLIEQAKAALEQAQRLLEPESAA